MKVFNFLLLFLFLWSCNVPKYYFKDDSQTTGVNFSEGKWLLDRIQSSKDNAKWVFKKRNPEANSFIKNKMLKAE